MARTPLYSRSPHRQAAAPEPTTNAGAAATAAGTAQAPSANAAPLAAAAQGDTATARWPGLRRPARWAWASAVLLLALLAACPGWRPKVTAPLTLAQIDRAVRESIAREPLPSATAAAYQAILPSVVRVTGDAGSDDDEDADTATAKRHSAKPDPRAGQRGRRAGPRHAMPDGEADAGAGARVGTGVVIVDSGLILTNLHVVAGAQRIRVTFVDGSTSEAMVVNRQPENDLAVLQARTLPDDLQAATMRATQGLSPGDAVVAVGFPFGIGPSASAGVVSGLKREFRSPRGQQLLSNLIQFDAAANPGNSGGPLVTLDGHVVGIVTAIMNPEGHSTFIGIGFAVPIENAAAAAGLTPF